MALFVPYDGDRIEIIGPRRIEMAAHDVERTARFYGRLFGLRLAADRRGREGDVVLSSVRDEIFLSLREARDGLLATPRSLAFAVEDLDRARETLWNQGVVPTRGGIPPSGRRGVGRFLVVRDPDGREIELVEDAVNGNDRLANGVERCPSLSRDRRLPRERVPACPLPTI